MDWVWGVAGLLVLAVGLVAVLYFTRMHSLVSRVGSFECALRAADSGRWSNGYATYGIDRIDWFAVASLRTRPRHTFRRSEVEVLSVVPRHSDLAGRDVVDVSITASGGGFELVMVADSFLALRSWLEAAPPTAVSFQ